MNPWREVVERLESSDTKGLVKILDGLTDQDRKEVAGELPGLLAERLAADAWWRWLDDDRATGLRLAGAACFGGAAQVAGWLNRRGLAGRRSDASHLLPVLERRSAEWRADLAVRLVERLRPSSEAGWWLAEHGIPGWELAADLIHATGIEPPDNDAFTAGWIWHLTGRMYMSGQAGAVAADPLLDVMVPRLFHAQGVAAALTWHHETTIAGELVALAEAGRLPRGTLLDGCVERFILGGQAAELSPFVSLWKAMRAELAEIPVRDFVRLLPAAASPVVQLAADELRRADAAGLVDDSLFAEAVQALVFRTEKKYVTQALQWMAKAAPARADGALPALASVFGQDKPALRDRAVRLAVQLAAHASGETARAVREAAATLPDGPRAEIEAAFGTVRAVRAAPLTVGAPVAQPLPALRPPIASPDELAYELEGIRWPDEPTQYERVLQGLVELSHRDRASVVDALRPWWLKNWQGPFASGIGRSGMDSEPRPLLVRCAVAIASPDASRALTAALADEPQQPDRALDVFLQRRFQEVIALFESGATLPTLLATPTEPTGHVDPATLIDRLERLGGTAPLPVDLQQALLRLPREIAAPQRLKLAAWLRDGGLPDPEVIVATETVRRPASLTYYTTEQADLREVHARMTPDAALPPLLAMLCALEPRSGYPAYSDQLGWWPSILPSHREVVAAHLLECLPASLDSTDGQVETLAALVHGEGPVGAALGCALTVGMGHRLPAQRAWAVDALVTLAARGDAPAADLGWAVAELVGLGTVKLNRVTAVLDEATASGAHGLVWAALAEALPRLLPEGGEKPVAGLGELLAVAAAAAELSGARGDVSRLAGLAARRGSSRVVEEARRLQQVLSAG
ncbi:DUF6493 family protein [Nonomuraea sp. NPDC050556]|uniref:DUF7824 domain-containing protein n=1 Tax=Nonomuraea sp. NPDC050556 TaxID=3364369 RepID=UPI0037ACF9B1